MLEGERVEIVYIYQLLGFGVRAMGGEVFRVDFGISVQRISILKGVR